MVLRQDRKRKSWGNMQGALHLRVWLLSAENPNTDNNIVNGANIGTVFNFVYLYTIIGISSKNVKIARNYA